MSRNMGYTYDLASRVIQETLPDNRVINYSYDANGNVTSITPPGRPAHDFDYTPVDLTKDYMPPDIGTATRDTNYNYDLDRRLTSVTRPVGAALPSFDDQKMSYAYDGSLLTSTTWEGVVNGTVEFTYDNDFRVFSNSVIPASPESFPSSVNFTYDDDGLLTGAGDLSINRDPDNGLLLGTTLGNVIDTWTYNGFGEPVNYQASYNASPLITVQYTRDKLGRITHKTETVGGMTHVYGYFYDITGRLTDVEKDGLPISHYEYDLNGNRLSHNGITATYDNQDRLVVYGDYEYTYTENGELAGKTGPSGTTEYGYDAFGNLVTVILPDDSVMEYVIDGENRRIGKKVDGVLVQGLLYEGQLRPVAELDAEGNMVSQFVYGTHINVPDYMIKNGVTYRIITDHLGSPRMVADAATGVVVQRMDYDEFGNIVYDSNPGFQPFGFAGGLYDKKTGLVRFGARDYDPVTGKWTAKDPIGFDGGDANLFGYTGSDPVNRIDPKGLFDNPLPTVPSFSESFPNSQYVAPIVDIVTGVIEAGFALSFGIASVVAIAAGPEAWWIPILYGGFAVEAGADAIDRITTGIDKLKDIRYQSKCK
jgi:RHS repeat-associated protein